MRTRSFVIATGIALGIAAVVPVGAQAQTPAPRTVTVTDITRAVHQASTDTVRLRVTYTCSPGKTFNRFAVDGYLAQFDRPDGWMKGFTTELRGPQYLTCGRYQSTGVRTIVMDRSADPVAYYPPRASQPVGTNKVLLGGDVYFSKNVTLLER